MGFAWNQELRDQLDFAWEYQFTPRMSGLSDDEYLLEPVAGCWSIRQQGGGRHVLDWSNDLPGPPPFTTIAWRPEHIVSFFGERASNHFGDGSFSIENVDLPATADGALALVEQEYRRWQRGVEALGEDGLFRPCGPPKAGSARSRSSPWCSTSTGNSSITRPRSP